MFQKQLARLAIKRQAEHQAAIPADLIKALNNKGCSLVASC
ncbi:hypothetical protein [Endozoicomonas sp. Mp262]